jgi:hypothetical protein
MAAQPILIGSGNVDPRGWILPDNRDQWNYPYREAQSDIAFNRQVEEPAAFHEYHIKNNMYDPQKSGQPGLIPDATAWEIDQLKLTAGKSNHVPRGRKRHTVSHYWNMPYMGQERPGNVQTEHYFAKYRESDRFVKRHQRDPSLKDSWSEWERGQVYSMPTVLDHNKYGVNPRQYKFHAIDTSGNYHEPGETNPYNSSGWLRDRNHAFQGGL